MATEETVPRRVIGIDPGPTPGVVVLGYADLGLTRVEALQCTAGAPGRA
jgi:hypothetical protein